MLREHLKTLTNPCLLALSVCAALAAHAGPASATEGLKQDQLPLLGSALPGLPAADDLPAPLDENDAAHYRRIFDLQAAGDFAPADELIARLHDPILLGHVLYQRYMHPTAYRSSFDELEAWLERYADHPGADRVYRLALARRPAGAGLPPGPVRGYLAGAGQELQEAPRRPYRTPFRRSPAEQSAVRDWRARIERLASAGQPDAARLELVRPELIGLVDHVELDLARCEVARGYLVAGEPAAALALAGAAAARSGDAVPEIHWNAGMSAWRAGRIDAAALHFAALANAEQAAPAERARAAFWAARAYLVGFQPALVRQFLTLAAEHARNFYGLLARSALGQRVAYDWQEVGLQDGVLQLLMEYPGAKRALALGQIGQSALAEQEIRKLAARATPELMTSLIALAGSLDLPAVEMRLAMSLGTSRGHYHYDALFPVPSWQPTTGFTLDRALVFAVMRAESGFDPLAESEAGARGVMQVMPGTASEIALKSDLDLPQADALFEPETAIQFGQAYLQQLLQRSSIGDNLIYLAAGYNAGPGRVMRWRQDLDQDDPLVFLESIPNDETRVYVKKVLTNLWTYRARLGQPQTELKALASSHWPRYRALDTDTGSALHAWN